MNILFRMFCLLLVVLITGCTTQETIERQEKSNSGNIYFMGSDSNILATREDIEQDSVKIVIDKNISYGVEARFKDPKMFEEITKKMLYQTIAIYNDDSLITSVMVSDVITNGHFTISGLDTLEKAKNIESLLKYGTEPMDR